MVRNDKALITGLSSAQSRRLAYKLKRTEEAKKSEGARLKPQAKWIMDIIAKERADVTNIEHIVLDMGNKDNLQAQIIAIQMHLNFLDKLNDKFKSRLRAEARDE